MKLGNILASDIDEITQIEDGKSFPLDMQEEDVQYLAFKIDKDFNPKGAVRF